MDFQLIVTDSAVTELLSICTNPEDMVRIFVQYGRKEGFTYSLTLDQEQNEDDILEVKEFKGKTLRLLIDSMTMQYLNGSTIDFKTDTGSLMIHNPNAGLNRWANTPKD